MANESRDVRPSVKNACVTIVVTGWVALLGVPAVLLAFFTPVPLIAGVIVVCLVALAVQRVARRSLDLVRCQVCNGELFPMVVIHENELAAGSKTLAGSYTLRVIVDCATANRLRCIWCGHEEGRRDEAMRFEP